jgi:hypothetical protein
MLSYFLKYHWLIEINAREHWRGNQNDNPEKLATSGTQDEEKQKTNITQ